MPRNGSGVYSKPAGTTAVAGTVIDPVKWNELTDDLGNELTNSLPRNGIAPMTAQLKGIDGTVTAPSFTFNSDANTGIYRVASDTLGFTAGGASIMALTPTALQVDKIVDLGSDGGEISFSSGGTRISFYTSSVMRFQMADVTNICTNNLAIYKSASTGQFALGAPEATPSFNLDNQPGTYLSEVGTAYASCSSFPASILKRYTSVGTIQQYYNGTAVVGSVSVGASTTTYNTSSDERLKEDFQPIPPNLLDAINVYNFAWRIDGERGYGVKAQELYPIFPQAVFRGDNPETDMWSVDYSKLVPLLISTVKDLRQRVAALEA